MRLSIDPSGSAIVLSAHCGGISPETGCLLTRIPPSGRADRRDGHGVDSQTALWESGAIALDCLSERAAICLRDPGIAWQGIYYYEFPELPDTIVRAIEQHFADVHNEIRQRVNALMPEPA